MTLIFSTAMFLLVLMLKFASSQDLDLSNVTEETNATDHRGTRFIVQ